jgi:hypothetical protein
VTAKRATTRAKALAPEVTELSKAVRKLDPTSPLGAAFAPFVQERAAARGTAAAKRTKQKKARIKAKAAATPWPSPSRRRSPWSPSRAPSPPVRSRPASAGTRARGTRCPSLDQSIHAAPAAVRSASDSKPQVASAPAANESRPSGAISDARAAGAVEARARSVAMATRMRGP